MVSIKLSLYYVLNQIKKATETFEVFQLLSMLIFIFYAYFILFFCLISAAAVNNTSVEELSAVSQES